MRELADKGQDRHIGNARRISEKPRLVGERRLELHQEQPGLVTLGIDVHFVVSRSIFGPVEGGLERAIGLFNKIVPITGHLQPMLGIVSVQSPVHNVQAFFDHGVTQHDDRNSALGGGIQKCRRFVAQQNFAQLAEAWSGALRRAFVVMVEIEV